MLLHLDGGGTPFKRYKNLTRFSSLIQTDAPKQNIVRGDGEPARERIRLS